MVKGVDLMSGSTVIVAARPYPVYQDATYQWILLLKGRRSMDDPRVTFV